LHNIIINQQEAKTTVSKQATDNCMSNQADDAKRPATAIKPSNIHPTTITKYATAA
jgi:hypothetical protein